MMDIFSYAWKYALFTAGGFLLILAQKAYGQDEINISTPQLQLKGNIIEITYDILNSSTDDLFNIWIEVTDSAGNQIQATSLVGDVGENVRGGKSKVIKWDLEADNTILDGIIEVEVLADLIMPDVIETELGDQAGKEISDRPKDPSRGVLIMQSVIFPGWGLSRNTGSPHWIKGIAGYGCIAGAYMFNQKASTSYTDYLNSTDEQQSDTYYNDAVKYDNISKALAYSAIGIWAVDIIWTIAGSSNSKKDKGNVNSKGFSVETAFNPHTKTTGLNLKYRF